MDKDNKAGSKGRGWVRPVVGVALLSMLVCGLAFPLLVTGVAQALFPYQANGEVATLNGQAVGSYLIDNSFTLPYFFHARPANESASGVDPDITLQEAYSQIPGIANATGIPSSQLTGLVQKNEEGVFWIFGTPYVDVLKLNLALIAMDPAYYQSRVPALSGS